MSRNKYKSHSRVRCTEKVKKSPPKLTTTVLTLSQPPPIWLLTKRDHWSKCQETSLTSLRPAWMSLFSELSTTTSSSLMNSLCRLRFLQAPPTPYQLPRKKQCLASNAWTPTSIGNHQQAIAICTSRLMISPQDYLTSSLIDWSAPQPRNAQTSWSPNTKTKPTSLSSTASKNAKWEFGIKSLTILWPSLKLHSQ
jgi:hypothetical protein